MTARTLEYYEAKKRRLRLRDRAGLFYVGNELQWVGSLRGGAGSFPDVPSRRMAQDADGTVLLHRLGAGVMENGIQADLTELNDEDNVQASGALSTDSSSGTRILCWLFPELREFDGGFHSATGSGSMNLTILDTSGDTTNGISGTFTSRTADLPNHFSTFDLYRDNIISYAVSNVRCVRIALFGGGSGGSKNWLTSHLYGEIAAGETPDRLLWIDNDDDLEFSKAVDYGDAPRGSAEDHVTYLKNNSASLAANSVQVTAEDLFLGSGSWYTFDDGTGFSPTKALASSISNGANSPNITIRRIIPDDEGVGLHAARAFVSVGSWT